MGSVAIGWQGPPITDVDTSVALHVLFRYLQVSNSILIAPPFILFSLSLFPCKNNHLISSQETSASPIHQRFVERASPLASGVDFGMRNYKVSQLVLEMDGVPMKWSKSDEGVQVCPSSTLLPSHLPPLVSAWVLSLLFFESLSSF